MTEEQLQAIKERAERVNPNRYDANDSFHSQLDVPALIAEVERLRDALEDIASRDYTFYEMLNIADKALAGESK